MVTLVVDGSALTFLLSSYRFRSEDDRMTLALVVVDDGWDDDYCCCYCYYYYYCCCVDHARTLTARLAFLDENRDLPLLLLLLQ